MTPERHHAASARHPRGSAFITTTWVIIVIAGLVLVMAQSIRVEAIACANRLSQAQADAAERGVEQFLCACVDSEVATPGSTKNISMEARQLGDCWFWVLKPDPADEENRAYGLSDEGGKIDINTASRDMLSMLPNMPPDVASSIYNWRGTFPSEDGLGATDADYQALSAPYRCKHSPFETTEELLLIKNVDNTLLFGSDKNRDGWIDPDELAAGGPASSISSANSSARGIFPCITAYGSRATNATVTTSGRRLVDVNVTVSETRDGRQEGDAALRNVLEFAGVSNVAEALQLGEAAQSKVGSYQTPLQWAAYANLSSGDFSKVYAALNAIPFAGGAGGPSMPRAKINVNTAPKQVLLCLPGFEESDANSIIARRQFNSSADPLDISWLLDAVPRNDLQSAAGYLTNTSYIYSADIVAVSSDGRAFSRYRVVIDGTKTPAYIIYRRSLHRLGWPIPRNIRDALRHGRSPPKANASNF